MAKRRRVLGEPVGRGPVVADSFTIRLPPKQPKRSRFELVVVVGLSVLFFALVGATIWAVSSQIRRANVTQGGH